jgi:ABC-2 type transport system permease protein
MPVATAILWAQWRTLRNRRGRGGGSPWTVIASAVWYAAWILAAAILGKIFSESASTQVIRSVLPATLLMVTLYWQVIPLLMATTGASLEMRKLRAYPIPDSQLFWIEAMLRATAGVEMILLLAGIGIGVLLNPAYPTWSVAAIPAYIVFNLLLAIGMRDLVARIVANKRVREVGFLFFAMCVALPQLFLARHLHGGVRLLGAMGGESWRGWPWAAAARLLEGEGSLPTVVVMVFWIGWAALFGRWQFSRALRFDADAAAATAHAPLPRRGLMERFYRLPSVLLPDPLGILIEKEFRTLMRSSRFRVVFLMGFTFGLMIWLPIALGYGGHRPGLADGAGGLPFVARNYLTVVSVYSLLLLSETCFWNAFGFDRSAAQFYFLAPVSFRTVLIAKNIASIFFVGAEICAVALVCVTLGLPMGGQKLAEAVAVAGIMSLFLVSAGNIQSIHQARGVNPANSFRTAAAGRVQASMFLLYPLVFSPIALAYAARYAFESEAAFFAVLAIDGILGATTYVIALNSAVDSAENRKERMISALSTTEGPIAA